eukprot:scaffold33501_cov79-Isochrysis_galbana.AAC.1
MRGETCKPTVFGEPPRWPGLALGPDSSVSFETAAVHPTLATAGFQLRIPVRIPYPAPSSPPVQVAANLRLRLGHRHAARDAHAYSPPG